MSETIEDLRIKMSIGELMAIQPYGQEFYYSFNFEEKLMIPIFRRITSPAEEIRIFALLTPGQKLFYSTVFYCAQVINGGLAQYFYNDYHKHIDSVIQCMGLLGENQLAECLASAYAHYRSHEVELLNHKMGGNYSAYATLMSQDAHDDLFFARCDEMQKKMVGFIKENASDFIII
jgi:hypothetical protein